MPSIKLAHGPTLAYDDLNFTDPWLDAETIVLVHGFSKNRRFWYRWLPFLARHYRVINLDMRGHGESASVLTADFEMSFEPFIHDIRGLLDELGLSKVHLVMAELASVVAILFAVRHPERIKSLIMPGFTYDFRTPTSVNRSEWIRIAEEEGSEAWARATLDTRLPADADERLKEWYVREQSRAPGWFLGKVFRFNGDTDLTEFLPRIAAPTLVLSGTEAKQATTERTRKGANLLPTCRAIIFDRMPLNVMSACPEACAFETLRFLDDLARNRGIFPEISITDPATSAASVADFAFKTRAS